MLELRASNEDIVSPYAKVFEGAVFHAGKRPWEVKVDIALPCATQNELNGDDAKVLIANGVMMVAEVSNMASFVLNLLCGNSIIPVLSCLKTAKLRQSNDDFVSLFHRYICKLFLYRTDTNAGLFTCAEFFYNRQSVT
jgi:hypothetical protein